jgi:hypothetical protein
MKRCYAVQHGDTITVFKDRLEDAIVYWQARPGSALVYKAHGRWGGQTKRSTRWLPVPTSSAGAVLNLALAESRGRYVEAEAKAAPVGG